MVRVDSTIDLQSQCVGIDINVRSYCDATLGNRSLHSTLKQNVDLAVAFSMIAAWISKQMLNFPFLAFFCKTSLVNSSIVITYAWKTIDMPWCSKTSV